MSNNIWTTINLKELHIARKELITALNTGDKEKIAFILRKMQIIRAFVINRNPAHGSHALLLKSFLMLFKRKIELYELPDCDFSEVFDILSKYALPEQLIAELSDVLFHERNRPAFFYLSDNIVKNQDKIKNKAVIAKTKHNLATWAENVDNDNNLSLSLNREALGLAREAGDVILEKKIKFGLKNTKLKTDIGGEGIKPAERLKDYLELAEFFIKHNCEHEAGRAYIEAGVGAFDLACLQSNDSARTNEYQKNISQAKKLAETSLKIGEKYEYTNIIILSFDLLSNIYKQNEDYKQAELYENKSKQIRESINYLTWLKKAKIK